MQFFLCLAFLFGLGGDWLFPSNARGQTAVPTAAVIEGAKKEGQVVFYTPLNINDSRPLLQRFEQKYPFIKTDLLRMSAEPLLNRIVTEDRAGRNVVDVINNTVITALKKARLLQAYRSPSSRHTSISSKIPRALGLRSTTITTCLAITPSW